jgi:hypothetical protein
LPPVPGAPELIAEQEFSLLLPERFMKAETNMLPE